MRIGVDRGASAGFCLLVGLSAAISSSSAWVWYEDVVVVVDGMVWDGRERFGLFRLSECPEALHIAVHWMSGVTLVQYRSLPCQYRSLLPAADPSRHNAHPLLYSCHIPVFHPCKDLSLLWRSGHSVDLVSSVASECGWNSSSFESCLLVTNECG